MGEVLFDVGKKIAMTEEKESVGIHLESMQGGESGS